MDYLIAWISGGALSSVVIGWLLKLWVQTRLKGAIELEYSEKLETYKAQVKHQYDLKIKEIEKDNCIMQERLRADLAIIAQERSVKMEWHHQRMAKALIKIYELIWNLRISVTNYVTIFRGDDSTKQELREQRHQEVLNAVAPLVTFYRPRRILFTRQTSERIEELIRNQHSKVFEYNAKVVAGGQDSSAEWLRIYEQVTSNRPDSLFAKLEEDFRMLLGHKPVSTPPAITNPSNDLI